MWRRRLQLARSRRPERRSGRDRLDGVVSPEVVPASYYSPDGDLAYFHLREPQGKVHSEEEPWGLRDLDETGALVGLELWGASEALPPAFLEAQPRLEGRGVTVEKTPEGLVVREREPA